MANLNKSEAIYLEGVVIANGVPDQYGDVLTKEDINKLMTSFETKRFDTQHSFLEENGIRLIKNYTTEKAKKIHGRDVPIGSWVADVMIFNEDIIQSINDKKYNGYSLASVPNKLEDILAFMGKEAPNYRDFIDKDDLTPMFISLVDVAGNGYEFDVYSYDLYIQRNGKPTEEKRMAEETNDMVSVMKEMLSIIERRGETTPVINSDGVHERFEKMDGRMSEFEGKIDGLEEKINKDVEAKLDEKLSDFLKKLDAKNTKAQEGNEGKSDDGKKDTKDDDKTEPSKDDDKKDEGTDKKPKVKVQRSAPKTTGVEHTTGSFDNPTFECPEPTVKRDFYGRPIRQ